jgi:hypothetical protein
MFRNDSHLLSPTRFFSLCVKISNKSAKMLIREKKVTEVAVFCLLNANDKKGNKQDEILK